MAKHATAADLVRQLREQRGTSLRTAAQDLGVAPSQLSRLERGERTYSDEMLSRLAKYYGIASELLALLDGQVPPDIVAILQQHPEEITELRRKYVQQ